MAMALAMAIALFCVGAPQALSQDPCGEDLDCLRQQYATHEVKTVNFWRTFQSAPIDQRVFIAPAQLLDYLNLDNRLNGFPNHPMAATPVAQFLQDLNAAISEIPPVVKSLVDAKLMGIFLVRDLGGTGFTDYVYDEQQHAVGAFVVLDVEVLTEPANTWDTWKENTPFTPDPEFTLQATIEAEADDDRKQALQYIVLHELGHVASVGSMIHPPWSGWDCVNDPPRRFAFFQLSWKLKDTQGCEVISRFDQSGFNYRPEVVYYFGARLPASASQEVYSQLEHTNFPTLYSATSPADDFAESFVTYVHNVLMVKPFEIRIDHQEERLITFTSCWGTGRCAAKQKMIAELFPSE